MSLSFDDLQAIRTIVCEELVKETGPLKKQAKALENDVKEIYFMLSAPVNTSE